MVEKSDQEACYTLSNALDLKKTLNFKSRASSNPG